ncbi:hypothetical protein DFH09DRAFT_1099440 [Mycena vulgaris]|nr:hypothetical protein DFH09DRAFT_1099440 [Mycena vulgaris]
MTRVESVFDNVTRILVALEYGSQRRDCRQLASGHAFLALLLRFNGTYFKLSNFPWIFIRDFQVDSSPRLDPEIIFNVQIPSLLNSVSTPNVSLTNGTLLDPSLQLQHPLRGKQVQRLNLIQSRFGRFQFRIQLRAMKHQSTLERKSIKKDEKETTNGQGESDISTLQVPLTAAAKIEIAAACGNTAATSHTAAVSRLNCRMHRRKQQKSLTHRCCACLSNIANTLLSSISSRTRIHMRSMLNIISERLGDILHENDCLSNGDKINYLGANPVQHANLSFGDRKNFDNVNYAASAARRLWKVFDVSRTCYAGIKIVSCSNLKKHGGKIHAAAILCCRRMAVLLPQSAMVDAPIPALRAGNKEYFSFEPEPWLVTLNLARRSCWIIAIVSSHNPKIPPRMLRAAAMFDCRRVAVLLPQSERLGDIVAGLLCGWEFKHLKILYIPSDGPGALEDRSGSE